MVCFILTKSTIRALYLSSSGKKTYNKNQLKNIQLKQVESPGLKVNKEKDVRDLFPDSHLSAV